MIDPVMHPVDTRSIRSITRRASLLLGVGGLLAACNVIPEVNKPLNLYSVSPKVAPVANPPALDWQLVVSEPKAGADLATNRIALTRAANRIEYFAEGGSALRSKRLSMLGAATVAVLFGVIAVLSVRVVWDDYRFGETSPGIGVPQWWYSIWLPVFSALITLRAVGLFIRRSRSKAR